VQNKANLPEAKVKREKVKGKSSCGGAPMAQASRHPTNPRSSAQSAAQFEKTKPIHFVVSTA